MVGTQTVYFPSWCGGGKCKQFASPGRREPATPKIPFRKQLAREMLENKIEFDGRVGFSPIRARKRRRLVREEFRLASRPPFTSHLWDFQRNAWRPVTTKYLKSKCSGCSNLVRTYCTCSKQVPLCRECYVGHSVAHDNA